MSLLFAALIRRILSANSLCIPRIITIFALNSKLCDIFTIMIIGGNSDISAEMKLRQKEYYDVLERTQHGDGDITDWILWFFHCFEQALNSTEDALSAVLRKADFWERNRYVAFNARQRKLLNMQFDGFFGKLTTGKWAKIAKCSTDTALNDIRDLVEKGVLRKAEEGGRSTNYVFMENP